MESGGMACFGHAKDFIKYFNNSFSAETLKWVKELLLLLHLIHGIRC